MLKGVFAKGSGLRKSCKLTVPWETRNSCMALYLWLQIVRVFAVAVVGLSSMAAYARSEAVRLPQQCHEHRLCLESLISWVYYMSLERCQCSNQLLFHERQEVEVGRTWHFAFRVAKW